MELTSLFSFSAEDLRRSDVIGQLTLPVEGTLGVVRCDRPAARVHVSVALEAPDPEYTFNIKHLCHSLPTTVLIH